MKNFPSAHWWSKTLSKFFPSNQLIYPSLVVALVAVGIETGNPVSFLLAVYFFSAICCKKQAFSLMLCLFCGFFVYLHLQDLKKPASINEGQLQMIQVLPDTIKVNGGYVSFDGKDQNNQLFRATYPLKSQAEQKQWQKRTDWHRKILVKAEFSEAAAKRNLGGFDYQKFLKYRGYQGNLKVKQIVKRHQIQQPADLNLLRAALIEKVENNFPEKLASYTKALLFGFKDNDYAQIEELFGVTGLLHLFSISGTHIYFFFGCLLWVFRRCGLTYLEAFLPLTALALIGTVLFGGSVGVWRASLLFLLGLLLKIWRLHWSGMDRFALVLLILLMLDPYALFDISGQLSLLMSGLLLFINRDTGDTSYFATSFWLTLLAAPVTAFFFFDWPLFGSLLTVLLLPIFTVVLLPLCLGYLLLTLLISLPDYCYLFGEWWIRFFEQALSFFKFASLRMGQPPLAILIGCLLLAIISYQQFVGKKRYLVFAVSLLVPYLAVHCSPIGLVSFIDVGQGDAILFKAPFNREVVLIDTGGRLNFARDDWQISQQKSNADYTVIPFLKSQGIRRIDKLFLTHGDMDHMGDAAELFDEFTVKHLYLGDGSQQHVNIRQLLKEVPAKTTIHLVKNGTKIKGHFDFDVLAPLEAGTGENEDSLVLLTKVKGNTLLLTGDLDQAGEQEIIEKYPNLQADVVKLGHHGSRTSSSARFLKQLQPKAAIVSAGKKNRYNHPHPEVVELLRKEKIPMYRTDQQGMIYYYWFFWEQQAQMRTLITD